MDVDLVKYDLTWTLIKYLDQHQILPLLNFLDEQNIYRKRDLMKAKLQLVAETKMVDFAGELYTTLYGLDENKIKEFEAKRISVHAELEDWTEKGQPLLGLLDSKHDELTQWQTKGLFTMNKLKDKYSVRDSNVPSIYHFAKLAFDCGMYEEAANVLHYFRELSMDNDFKFQALWGKLAAEILLADPTRAYEDLGTLNKAIDEKIWSNQLEVLIQRTWIIHWSLFVFVNLQQKGINLMVSFLTSETMLNTIQTNCPHILRYLAVCTVLNNQNMPDVIPRIVAAIKQERENYSDPLTEFLAAIYIDYDFDGAQELLKVIERVWSIDFFLNYYDYATYVECARVLIFETFCKVHHQISLSEMNQVLELPADNNQVSERKILELLRKTKSDGKIDTSRNQIIIAHSHHSIYQQMVEKTKYLSNRTSQLMEQVEKRYVQTQDGHD